MSRVGRAQTGCRKLVLRCRGAHAALGSFSPSLQFVLFSVLIPQFYHAVDVPVTPGIYCMPMKRISLFLKESQIRKLNARAKLEDRSMAGVLRRAVDFYFRAVKVSAKKPKR